MTQQGSSNRLRYDNCAYAKTLSESVSPFAYMMYDGKFENCGKCKLDNAWRPYYKEVVDVESDLKNITRPATKCPSLKYNPKCKKSPGCVSTFDPSVPVILDRDVCPIVFNNIPRMQSNGLVNPDKIPC
jgi:hypothetical protein